MSASTMPGQASVPERIVSLDVLRGLVMFTMVFVNDLAGVGAAPPWMKHAPSGTDAMTFVDVVFPAFLFIVGMSIPVAVSRRLTKGVSRLSVFSHAVVRTLSLLIIGVYMVNHPSSENMIMTAEWWCFLMYASAIAVWHRVTPESDWGRYVSGGIRIAGAGMLVFLAIVYRNADGGIMHHQWWGILGLIGWAYIVALSLYLLIGNRHAGLVGAMGILYCLYVAFREGRFANPWLGGSMIGSHPAITLAGAILGTVMMDGGKQWRDKVRWALTFAGFMAVAAWLVRPLYGIDKNAATPSWCLWSSVITCLIWVALYIVIDVRKGGALLRPLRYVGGNALFAYLLAPLLIYAMEVAGIPYQMLGDGAFLVGLGRSIAYALLISACAGYAVRIGMRLRL